jgi:DNA (cytosine-5)-methyltransferase 1
VLGAVHAGAPHRRERIWILASDRSEVGHEGTASVRKLGRERSTEHAMGDVWWKGGWGETPVEVAPGNGRMDVSLADRMERIAAVGNGQVPAVVRLAWNTLSQRINP